MKKALSIFVLILLMGVIVTALLQSYLHKGSLDSQAYMNTFMSNREKFEAIVDYISQNKVERFVRGPLGIVGFKSQDNKYLMCESANLENMSNTPRVLLKDNQCEFINQIFSQISIYSTDVLRLKDSRLNPYFGGVDENVIIFHVNSIRDETISIRYNVHEWTPTIQMPAPEIEKEIKVWYFPKTKIIQLTSHWLIMATTD